MELEIIRDKIFEVRGRRPYAFTEQGVAMLSGLLKSDMAIAELSIKPPEAQKPRRPTGFNVDRE